MIFAIETIAGTWYTIWKTIGRTRDGLRNRVDAIGNNHTATKRNRRITELANNDKPE